MRNIFGAVFSISLAFNFYVSHAFASADACKALFAKSLEQTRTEMKSPDKSTKIERRIKILTSGLRINASSDLDPGDIKIDSADPSLVMPMIYPNGEKFFRINFSGMRYIESKNAEDFFHGGIYTVKRSRGFYADGTEMTGPYHNASWPWDVVIYKNDQGENIALGGVMEQPAPNQLPNMANDNITRSRWWGKVEFVKQPNGEFEEQIFWQAPVNDFNKIKREPRTWEYHGYGGTLLTKFNPATGIHEPIKNERGNYSLFYERVIEDKNGNPWVTTMFTRDMDPSLKFTVGDEISVTNLISPVSHEYFKAIKRGPFFERPGGYLAEGGNVLIEKEHNMAIKVFSANDFVRKYGIYLDFRPPNSDPQAMYTPAIDSQGELIDFASTMNLREVMHATWLGRPQLIYDRDGKLWLEFHFVPKESIPEGAPVEGWPSAKDFVEFGRITAMAPVKIEMVNGQPHLKLDVDAEYK